MQYMKPREARFGRFRRGFEFFALVEAAEIELSASALAHSPEPPRENPGRPAFSRLFAAPMVPMWCPGST